MSKAFRRMHSKLRNLRPVRLSRIDSRKLGSALDFEQGGGIGAGRVSLPRDQSDWRCSFKAAFWLSGLDDGFRRAPPRTGTRLISQRSWNKGRGGLPVAYRGLVPRKSQNELRAHLSLLPIQNVRTRHLGNARPFD